MIAQLGKKVSPALKGFSTPNMAHLKINLMSFFLSKAFFYYFVSFSRITRIVSLQEAKIDNTVIDPPAIEILASITASKVRVELKQQGRKVPKDKLSKKKKEAKNTV